jgi:hypothetical protein
VIILCKGLSIGYMEITILVATEYLVCTKSFIHINSLKSHGRPARELAISIVCASLVWRLFRLSWAGWEAMVAWAVLLQPSLLCW